MRMTDEDIKKYDKFYKYVSLVLPKVGDRIGAMTIIANLSGEDEEVIREALIWGRGPMIKIVRTIGFGYYNPKKRDEIAIRRKWVKQFEKGNGKRGINLGEPVELVEVILLHELTHWADDRDYLDQTGPNVEEGNEFEMSYYGKIVTPRTSESY